MRMQATLLLSQDIFSLEKKPMICGEKDDDDDGASWVGGVLWTRR